MQTRPNYLGFAFLVLLLFSFRVSAQLDTVYTDSFTKNWYSDSWGGNNSNIVSTTDPFQGTHCIEIDFTDWGSYGFDHREEYWAENYYFYPNQYQYLNFYFNPGNQINQIANIAVTLDLGKSVKIKEYIEGTITANAWYNVRIPIIDINPDNKKFFRIYFSNESSSLTPHIFIDNLFIEYIADNSAPAITNVNVSEIEQDAATISWENDESAVYVVKYRELVGLSDDTFISSEEYEPGGSVVLSDLIPNTAYFYEITCKDHQKDPEVSANESTINGIFVTSDLDTTPPEITNLRVIDEYSNRVVIGWNTDEPSKTVLEYGQGDYNTSYTNELFTTGHTVVLTHLRPGIVFQYKVVSIDKRNNIEMITEIPPKTFTTKEEAEEPDRWIVTDHPIYQWDEVGPDEVPWDKITHLNLGQLWPVLSDSGYTLGIEPNSYWSGEWGGFAKWETEAKKFIASGHNANRKIICMLGGAGSNPDGQWNDATASENISEFAQNIRKVLESIGFDGTDIDWEDDIDFSSFVNLARELRKAWPHAIITIPTGLNGDDAQDFAPANDYVDAFTPMSYYPIPQWGGWLIPIPITPLYPAGENPYGIEYTRNKWLDAGVPASKLIMGVGGFGSVWGDSNEDGLAPVRPYVNTNDLNGSANGETEALGSDNLVSWTFVNNVLQANPKLQEGWDATGLCTYWHTGDSTKQIQVLYPDRSYYLNISLIFYETARSMSEKVKYIEDNDMKGVGYWTLSQLIYNGSSPVLDVASCMNKDTSTIPVVNIPERANSAINIYPNPVQNFLHIDNVDTEMQVHLKILDCLGKIVVEKELEEKDNFIELPASEGILIIVLTDNSGKIVENMKIVKL